MIATSVQVPVLCPVLGCREAIDITVDVQLGIDAMRVGTDSPALLAEVELHVLADHADVIA